MPGSGEAIWYSERNDWGNLYLYDLKTGALEHPITTGDGDVTEVLHVDPEEAARYGSMPSAAHPVSTRIISSSGKQAWMGAVRLC